MARPFPWLYGYTAERVPRRGREVLRPAVTVSIPAPSAEIEPFWDLVDTGSESVLAADWLADFAEVDLSTSSDKAVIGIGGQVIEVTFAEVELRLHAPDDAAEFISWRADVGFVPHWQAPFALVLGQVGFLDRFTATFHRGAAAMAIEDRAVFDDRFGGAPSQ